MDPDKVINGPHIGPDVHMVDTDIVNKTPAMRVFWGPVEGIWTDPPTTLQCYRDRLSKEPDWQVPMCEKKETKEVFWWVPDVPNNRRLFSWTPGRTPIYRIDGTQVPRLTKEWLDARQEKLRMKINKMSRADKELLSQLKRLGVPLGGNVTASGLSSLNKILNGETDGGDIKAVPGQPEPVQAPPSVSSPQSGPPNASQINVALLQEAEALGESRDVMALQQFAAKYKMDIRFMPNAQFDAYYPKILDFAMKVGREAASPA